jgi:phospholipase A1
MDNIIFVPGIEGSTLALNGIEIWPLTLSEIIFGYPPSRIDQLLDPAAVATGIVKNVACIPIYQTLDDDLGIIANWAGATKIQFYYDWRKDILTYTAPLLASVIEERVKKGGKSITLVAHSMGGLVARLVLEDPKYNTQPWFASIKALIAICTPHHGAPQAICEALGLQGSSGLHPSDMPRLTSDNR